MPSTILTGAKTLVYLNDRRLRCAKSIKLKVSAKSVAKAKVSFYEPLAHYPDGDQHGSYRFRLIDLPNGRKKLFVHTLECFVTKVETNEQGRTVFHLVASRSPDMTEQDIKFYMELIDRCTEPAKNS